jgi:NAD dependent epimerase/dehydratase
MEGILGKKVLVTGAAGFIGSHLSEQLILDGYDVRAFVHYNSNSNWYNLEKLDKNIINSIEIIQGDVSDGFAVDKAVDGCEVVFHLAALIGIPYSYVAPGAYISTNVGGTLNVLEACKRRNTIRLIHTSTSETYGTAQYVPIDEKHPLVGQSPYSASKIGADKLVESYYLSFNMPVTTVRPFNTYGPRQSMRAIIPTIIVQGLHGKQLALGNLDPIRDLTYVKDTVRGFIAAAKSEKVIGEVVNLGVGKGVSIGTLVEQIGGIIGKKLIPSKDIKRVRPENSEVMQLISNNKKAKELMGWEPEINLNDGLLLTIQYVEKHLTEYKDSIYAV